MAKTLSTLRTRAKQLADMESSSFVTDAEWLSYINESLSELHDLIVTKYENYLIKTNDFTLVDGTESYTLPSDFYKAMGCDFVDGDIRYTLSRHKFRERNLYREAYVQSGLAAVGPYYEYRLQGNNIIFIPEPGTGTIRLYYIPVVTELAIDADEVDVAYITGWDELVVLSAAIKALAKEESLESAQLLMARKAQVMDRIDRAAQERDAGEPPAIHDVWGHPVFSNRARHRRWGW